MPCSISPLEAEHSMQFTTLIDVRKEPARLESGLTIPGAQRRTHDTVMEWRGQFTGKSVVLFCVHGHEVSRNACAALVQNGVDARYLDGGFEAWRSAGLAVVPLEQGQ
ncbi:MAG: rhodanese-like domain-containing protein [Rhizobiaceae bacterium]